MQQLAQGDVPSARQALLARAQCRDELLTTAELIAALGRGQGGGAEFPPGAAQPRADRGMSLPTDFAAISRGRTPPELERPAALERQSPGRPPLIAGLEARDKKELRPREIAAKSVGLSEPSYRRPSEPATSTDAPRSAHT